MVEDIGEAQERALREELRRWRRADDPFVYEIVVVPSLEDAVMAARLNYRLQACVVRRRFAHRSRHDSSSLRQFVDSIAGDDLMEHSPDDRAQRAAQLQPPADRGFPRAADLARQVDRRLALDQGHGRLLRPGHLPRRDVGDLRRAGLAVTNGTSTANKIVVQALVQPGDIVLVDRNCHQSHHYGLMLAGAMVTYLEAYPMHQYSMYGAVPLREIKEQLLALRRAGKLDRVKMLLLTTAPSTGSSTTSSG